MNNAPAGRGPLGLGHH